LWGLPELLGCFRHGDVAALGNGGNLVCVSERERERERETGRREREGTSGDKWREIKGFCFRLSLKLCIVDVIDR